MKTSAKTWPKLARNLNLQRSGFVKFTELSRAVRTLLKGVKFTFKKLGRINPRAKGEDERVGCN